MTSTDTRNVGATVRQIKRLAAAGCEIVRLAIPDMEAVRAFSGIKKRVSIPLIADIHFDHRLAIASLEAGADGIRINPGNIGGPKAVEKIIRKAKETDAAIRIGVNSGSLPKGIMAKHGHPTPQAMLETALEYIALFEGFDFDRIKVSLKSSPSQLMSC
jgi:(E)-4-hydroxy-3-methylbut-2-enyl-diphosphate synthase